MALANRSTGERVLFLPESIGSSQKICTISGSVDSELPEKIIPVSGNAEQQIIKTMMNEIGEKFAVPVDLQPNLDRCSGDTVFCKESNNTSRVFEIGGSHITRLVGPLAESGVSIVNLASPGWKLTDDSAQDLRLKLRNYNAHSADYILIDPLSNNVFCGTDCDGNMTEPVKLDDKWHITGELNIRTKSYLKVVLSRLKIVTTAYPELKIMVLVQIPRYVSGKCCDNVNHVTNFGEPAYVAEFSEGLERVEELVTGWLQSLPTTGLTVDFRAGTDEPGGHLPDLTAGGVSVWNLADPVHPMAALYSNLAAAIVHAMAEFGPELIGNRSKRPRLDSMVVRKAVQMRPQSWSLGILPDPPRPNRGGGRGGQRGALNVSRGRGGQARGPARARGWRGSYSRGPRFWAPRKF
jgi:hypothetical protein